MHELNSFRNATFLNRLRSATRLTQQKGASQLKFQAGECSPDPSNSTSDIFLEEIESEMVEQFRLREILEEACLVTGATGAAIALARGKEMVCCANAGTDAPDLGVCLDLRHGLSGTCIQTRQLQQCTDTETDPRVDRQVCRQLGVRSLAVLPVLQGTELLGIFEILSSRPNAFGQGELDSLQALSCRILPRKLQEVEVTAKVTELQKCRAMRPRVTRAPVDTRTLTLQLEFGSGHSRLIRPSKSRPTLDAGCRLLIRGWSRR